MSPLSGKSRSLYAIIGRDRSTFSLQIIPFLKILSIGFTRTWDKEQWFKARRVSAASFIKRLIMVSHLLIFKKEYMSKANVKAMQKLAICKHALHPCRPYMSSPRNRTQQELMIRWWAKNESMIMRHFNSKPPISER